MSTFDVTLRRISKVWLHPNADRLEMAEVEGLAYQFVVPKGAHAAGDRVLYFPIDALLPDELSTRLGVKNYLVGPLKNRVKTARLRGEISQGVVVKPMVEQRHERIGRLIIKQRSPEYLASTDF